MSTGVHAHATVNVDKAKAFWWKGKNMDECVFKRTNPISRDNREDVSGLKCVATHQHCLVVYSFFERHTSPC